MSEEKPGPSGRASFLSSGIDAILSSKNEEEDLYSILGCHPSSSAEQIQTEYKLRALRFHPDKNPGDATAERHFQLLQFAKETLCDEERRATYDKWRSSGLTLPFREWLAMKDRVKTSMHWATPRTADRMLPAETSDESTRPPPGEARPAAGESIRWGRPEVVGWRRAEGSDLVKKFRNYEI